MGRQFNQIGDIMAVLINVQKELGIRKKIEVKESNANMRKTFKFQRDLARVQIEQAKLQDKVDNAKDEEESAKTMDDMFGVFIDQLDNVQEYIIDMLKLDEKYQEKLDEELGFDESVELASKVASAILKVEETEASEEGSDLKA